MNTNGLITVRLKGLLPTATVVITDISQIYGHLIIHVPMKDTSLVWNTIASIDDMLTEELDQDILELTVRHATQVSIMNQNTETRFEITFNHD